MGGSKADTKTEQSSSQLGDTGVVSGQQLQAGGDISYYTELPDEAVDIFNNLVNFASEAGLKASGIAESAIDKVSERATVSENPTLASQTALTPVILGVSALAMTGLGAVYLLKK